MTKKENKITKGMREYLNEVDNDKESDVRAVFFMPFYKTSTGYLVGNHHDNVNVADLCYIKRYVDYLINKKFKEQFSEIDFSVFLPGDNK